MVNHILKVLISILLLMIISCKSSVCVKNSYNKAYSKYEYDYRQYLHIRINDTNTINWYEQNKKPFPGANKKMIK